LQFLMAYCGSLYNFYEFRFVDSFVYKSFDNDAMLILATNELKLKFSRDRSQLFLEFQSTFDKKKNNWYSFDLIRQLITGEDEYFSLMNADNAYFFKKNVDCILDLFSKNKVEATLEKLNRLEKKRSKKLFK